VVDPSEQSTLTLGHVHDSAIGALFVFIDATLFNDAQVGDEWTVYGEASSRFSLRKVLNKDVSLALTPLRGGALVAYSAEESGNCRRRR
jgi:hypothetical protein